MSDSTLIDGVRPELVDQMVAACVKTYKQGIACMYNGVCAYQIPDVAGVHCTIGHLMTEDELTRYGRVNGGIHTLIRDYKFRPDLAPPEIECLSMLQDAHDDENLDESQSWSDGFAIELKQSMKIMAPNVWQKIQQALIKEGAKL